MALPTAQELAAAIEKYPDAVAYLNETYPLPRKGQAAPRDLQLSGIGRVNGDVYSEIKPTEAERIAEAATVPTGSPEWQEPNALMNGLDTSGVIPGVTGRVPNRRGVTATVTPPTMAPVSAPASPVMSAPSLASGLAVTPNYYLGSHPVNYGVATGGGAPAGTVTPQGNVVAGNYPAAGTQGGGGKPPAGSMTPAQGMLAQTALSSLSGAATSYAASQAVPDPTLAVVNPAMADFPIITIQPKQPIMG